MVEALRNLRRMLSEAIDAIVRTTVKTPARTMCTYMTRLTYSPEQRQNTYTHTHTNTQHNDDIMYACRHETKWPERRGDNVHLEVLCFACAAIMLESARCRKYCGIRVSLCVCVVLTDIHKYVRLCVCVLRNVCICYTLIILAAMDPN